LQQRHSLIASQSQRISQEGRGFAVGMRAGAPLEITDCSRAHPGHLGQRRLCQGASATMVAQEIAKARSIRWEVVRHGSTVH
jgi:hypothetical protein